MLTYQLHDEHYSVLQNIKTKHNMTNHFLMKVGQNIFRHSLVDGSHLLGPK